ncbi:MAG TPA: CrcB family protein [Candidatus Dormibacteraeota bacterium]
MRTLAGIMIAGSLGAAARYGVDGVVSQHLEGAFPWGTFVVNITASLLLGIIFTLTTERALVDSSTRVALTVGFIGSYSTFSTLMLESVRLASEGAYGLALVNGGGSVVAGMVALTGGILIGRAL